MNASSNNSTPDQSIAQRIAAVREQMAAACARSGRFPDAVTLIAVSKTHPAAAVMEAVTVGVRDFGENRVEEAGKIAVVTAEYGAVPLTWHMIGHVQSRKAGDILPHYRWIHSLDSVKLAERFARLLRDDQGVANVVSVRPIDALIEINISGEASKDGFAASHWQHDADQRNTLWLPSVR